MLDINVEMDLEEIEEIATKHAPYVLSRVLNDLAFLARQSSMEHAKDQYIIRRPWMMRGFRVEKSNRNFLRSMVYHRDSYMHKHERGGMVNISKLNAIPQRSGLKRAREELRKPNTFFRGRSIVRRKNGTRKYERIFNLINESHYDPTLKMEEITARVVSKNAENATTQHWNS